MTLLRNPVAQFLAFGLLLIVLISIGTTRLAQNAAQDEARAEAREVNAVLAESLLDKAGLAEARFDNDGRVGALLEGRSGAIDVYDRKVQSLLLIGLVSRVNIWSESGTLIYSNAFRVIGQKFPLSDDQQDVLANGGTGNEISDPLAPENVGIEGTPGLKTAQPQQQIRIYTRVLVTDDDVPVLFEGYYTLDDIEDRRERIYASFRWIAIGGPLLLVLIVTPLLWVLTRRLTSAARDRERLLHASLDASDAERRRIARDLHDSVVQDLAGTAFSVSAVAREPGLSETARGRLDDAGVALRSGLKALRSLLVEIHPPDLHAEGLSAALADLIAPASAAGVQASVSVEGAEIASDGRAALVWRVAQEAVRNALRHAEASTLAVTVRVDGNRLVLEVVDDGMGFDPTLKQRADSLGLRGLRSLVAEAGGTLKVQSSPGEGTAVLMEVAAR